MITIRIGNDIDVIWKIFSRNGLKFSLEGKNIRLWLISGPFKREITDFQVQLRNEIKFFIDADDIHRYGVYKLLLSILDENSETEDASFDVTEIFQIVSKVYPDTNNNVLDGNVVITPCSVLNNIETSTLEGASAYEIAVNHGYTGTEEEWLADTVHGIKGVGIKSVEQTVTSLANGGENKVRITLNDAEDIEDCTYEDIIIRNGLSGADEEDITDSDGEGTLKFKDRIYDSENPNGMGYVILRKDKPFATQVTMANTIYEIRYGYNLNGANIILPENSVLRFIGGIISNGNLVGQNSKIIAPQVKIFDTNISLSGVWTVGQFYASWFGCSVLLENNEDFINNALLQLNAIGGGTLLIDNDYVISSTIILRANVSICGIKSSARYSPYYSNAFTTIKCKFSNINSWAFDSLVGNSVASYDVLSLPDGNHPSMNYIKISELNIININTRGTEAIFGALRPAAFQNSVLENVALVGFKYGLCLSWSWSTALNHVTFATRACGLYLGEACTIIKALACSFSRTTLFTGELDHGLISSALIPPYADSIRSSAIIQQGDSFSTNYHADASYTSCSFEVYDAIALVSNSEVQFTNAYWERIPTTLVYAVGARCYIGANLCGSHVRSSLSKEDGTYEFGVSGSYAMIKADGVPVSRCYPSDSGFYEIHVNPALAVTYFDTIERGDNNIILSKSRTKNKRFINIPKRIYFRKPNETIDDVVTNCAALCLGNYGAQSSADVFFADIYNELDEWFLFSSYEVWPAVETIIRGKRIHLRTTRTNGTNSPLYFTNALKLQDSDLYIGVNLQPTALVDDSYLHCYGKCKISLDTDEEKGSFVAGKQIIKLSGNAPCDIEVYLREGLYSLLRARLIENPEFSYPYRIRVFEGGILVDVKTNTSRPTSGLEVGYSFFDSSLSPARMIFWSGSQWKDAAGDAV